MDLKDLGARFKKVQDEKKGPPKVYDHNESFRLRSKMLGVLIHDARLNAARTKEDCARLLSVQPQLIEAWEYGDAVPDMPQLELLAFYLDVNISHFWGQTTLESDKANKVDSQSEYMQLRHKMIGALLQQAREEAGLSVEEVAQQAQVDVAELPRYEAGDVPIPMNVLPVLSNIVNKNIDYFLETTGYVGELLKIREEWKKFTDLDPEIRKFAANPLNIGFIKIAITFSKMPAEQLRLAAEGMLDISM